MSSGLITAYLLVRSMIDHEYGQMVWRSKIAQISLAMFLLGLVTATIGAEELTDITWMARKTLFLPVIVFFAFALEQPRNRTVAITGLIATFWVASLITLNAYDWQLHFGGRMEGHWPQGTWDTLLGLFFPFTVFAFKWKNQTSMMRIGQSATIFMALLMLFLAGGRATWVGALASIFLYYFVFKFNIRTLMIGALTSAIFALLISTVFYDRAQPILDRFASIADTETEGSNWIRLQLWKIGLKHMQEFAFEDPKQLLFGGGAESYDAKQRAFFSTLPYDRSDRIRLVEYGYPTGDTHNTYLDNALRHGIVWTSAMTLYLIWLCIGFRFFGTRTTPSSSALLLNLLIVGIFYTVVPHFATFFFALFVLLLQSSPEPLDR